MLRLLNKINFKKNYLFGFFLKQKFKINYKTLKKYKFV